MVMLASLKKLNHKWGFVIKNMIDQASVASDAKIELQRTKDMLEMQRKSLMEHAFDVRNHQVKDSLSD